MVNSIEEKLKYIGLNLNKVPSSIKKNFTAKIQNVGKTNETRYKVYKYINIKDIDIYLTQTNRLTDANEKYKKAVPIFEFLNSDNIEKYTEFLRLLKNIKIEDILLLEQEQQKLNKKIPYSINFYKDYLWQIYYSKESDKYYMLAPINDTEYGAIFYLLKKQLEKTKEKIYVPICGQNYTNKLLSSEKIEEIENYIWYFTKRWPLIYEVYDENESLSLNIFGESVIYENLTSQYKIKLNDKEEAEKFFGLLKSLFILQNECNHLYKFNVKVQKDGLDFYFQNKKINYEDLAEFIKEQFIICKRNIEDYKIEIEKTEQEINRLKQRNSDLEEEFWAKEKQIATFLECKKTFIGRVKYFFKYKKSNLNNLVKEKRKILEKKQTEEEKIIEKIKERYTIRELVDICIESNKKLNLLKNLKLDLDKLKRKIEIIVKKLENADKYIKEIEEHKKSIFEFWKFTSKDESAQLNEGEKEQVKINALKRTFNLDTDFEELASKIDKMQRENLSEAEINSISLLAQETLDDINLIKSKSEITENTIKKLKQEKKQRKDNFDVLLGLSNKEKILGNTKHREEKRDKLDILDIKEEMTKEEYVSNLENHIKNINLAMKKTNLNLDIPVYAAKKSNLNNAFEIFYINPKNAIKEESGSINLYKVNLKENIECVALSNIIFFKNKNQTLPLGMNVKDGIILDLSKNNLKLKNTTSNNIIKYDEKTDKLKITKLKILEYDL